MKKRYILIPPGVILGTVMMVMTLGSHRQVAAKTNLLTFSAQELSQYDGTDPNKPIYIALNGNVYDVTKGKKFYIPGGPYHDLAGKDSSVELNKFGGKIIEHKYPIIGTYIAK